MDWSDPSTRRVLSIVAVVLGYAFSITVGNRTLKRIGFLFGSAALFMAFVQAAGEDGLVPALYHWVRGTENWLPDVVHGNSVLFLDYLTPLRDLALVFGVIAGLFAALALLDVKLLNQVARVALVALLAAFVGGLATIRVLSVGFGGYGSYDEFFGRPGPDDVLDGDTLRIRGAELRLAGIDAPEFRNAGHSDWNKDNQPCLIEGQLSACGHDARDALVRLVAGQRVICTRLAPGFSDKWGRPVVTCVTVMADSTQTDIAEAMAESGYAAPPEEDRMLDPAYAARLKIVTSEARSAKKGIWAGCLIKPRYWRLDGPEGARLRDAFKQKKWDEDQMVDTAACRH